MKYDFSDFKSAIAEAKEWLKKEFSGLRSGQATPAILDSVKVESYGARMPIAQMGSVTLEDTRTLRIVPWDSSLVKSIERAIQEADLGLSVVVDDKGLRAIFPELTLERRDQMVKIMKDKVEQARITLRRARDEAKSDILAKEKSGELPEDEKFRALEEMQTMVDSANKELEEMGKRKETEIRG